MSYRSDRFNASMRSLDQFSAEFDDPSKITTFSDRGAGVERMLEQIEPTPDDAPDPNQALAGAILRLVVCGKEHLVPTLLLIARNGSNREESIGSMNRATYFRHRDRLLEFFGPSGVTRKPEGPLSTQVRLWCTYDLRGRDVGEVPTR